MSLGRHLYKGDKSMSGQRRGGGEVLSNMEGHHGWGRKVMNKVFMEFLHEIDPQNPKDKNLDFKCDERSFKGR
jgi:hypothetical protein